MSKEAANKTKPQSLAAQKKAAPLLFDAVRPNKDSAMMATLTGPAATQAEPLPITTPLREPSGEPLRSVAGLKPGMTELLHRSVMVESEFNARFFYKTSELDEMALSLQNTQDVPLVGYIEDGKVKILDGVKRLKASDIGGIESLRVEICEKPQGALGAYKKSFRVNKDRSAGTALDDAMKYAKFIEDGMPQQVLAKELERDIGTVSQLIAISKIPMTVLIMMKDSERASGLRLAYEISQIFRDAPAPGDEVPEGQRSHADLVQIAREVIEAINGPGTWNRDTVQALIKSKLTNETKRRERATSQQLSYGGVKGTLKVFEKRGELGFQIKGLDAERLQTLKEKIEKVLAEESKQGTEGGV